MNEIIGKLFTEIYIYFVVEFYLIGPHAFKCAKLTDYKLFGGKNSRH